MGQYVLHTGYLEFDSLRPVSRRVATLGDPAYFPAMYRIPSKTSKAAVSFVSISEGVMFCQSGNRPPAWKISVRSSPVCSRRAMSFLFVADNSIKLEMTHNVKVIEILLVGVPMQIKDRSSSLVRDHSVLGDLAGQVGGGSIIGTR